MATTLPLPATITEFIASNRSHRESKARLLLAIQQADTRGIAQTQGFHSTTAFIVHSCALTYGTAKEYVFIARSMANFLYAADAWSFTQVDGNGWLLPGK